MNYLESKSAIKPSVVSFFKCSHTFLFGSTRSPIMTRRLDINYESLALAYTCYQLALKTWISPYLKSMFCHMARLPLLSMACLTCSKLSAKFTDLDSFSSCSLSSEILPNLFCPANYWPLSSLSNQSDSSLSKDTSLRCTQILHNKPVYSRERHIHAVWCPPPPQDSIRQRPDGTLHLRPGF